ncbi:hypothetical protein CMsap09_13070 [Clavibacter michiganensis]|uniref:ABM domain-containing protein n=1 Tax=Clavibacter michiganensis TaxID=28447 RepID=A0A251XWB4_9MICO|nr:hypothetical protein CMsap09_13070 [Clavibacter michiganensis]
MNDVDFDDFPFVVMVNADVSSGNAGVDRVDPRASAEALARSLPGYGGAIRLTQGRVLGPSSTPDAEVLLGLVFWAGSSAAERFTAELGRRPVDGLVLDGGIYRFSATVPASPDDATPADLTSARFDLAHEIIRMTPVMGKQGWILEYNESETRDHISTLDGFVSTSFFRDLRSDRIVEYVQWRSADHLTSAFGDARFAEHMSVNSHYSEGQAFLFSERSTAAAPVDGPAHPAVAPHEGA